MQPKALHQKGFCVNNQFYKGRSPVTHDAIHAIAVERSGAKTFERAHAKRPPHQRLRSSRIRLRNAFNDARPEVRVKSRFVISCGKRPSGEYP